MAKNRGNVPRARRGGAPAIGFFCALTVAVVCALVPTASALIKYDFEMKFYTHHRRQVWDFCLVRPDSLFHIFYHSIHEDTPNAIYGDTIWHATSLDLKHWEPPVPVLTAGPDWADAGAIWAPDVVYNEDERNWTMLYTGVDQQIVQRICAAHSPDLYTWTKEPTNPVMTPDSLTYYWSPNVAWSDCRDPFLYWENDEWNMLTTMQLRVGGYPGEPVGILQRSTSSNLIDWVDQGAFFVNNGDDPDHVLESCQYNQRGSWYHLFFAEFDVYGISHISTQEFGTWDMADRTIVDWGGAPEIDQFDPGIDIISRIAAIQDPFTEVISYVVRFDTLQYTDGGATPEPFQPNPLDLEWAYRSGSSTNGNPTFGDNPTVRGDPPSGMVGNGYFGSQEYYQGPLSGRGSPGAKLGNFATGRLVSYPFTITGNFIQLLVGGGNYPNTAFIALMDANTDTVLFKETGRDDETMSWRLWDVRANQGQFVYLLIEDFEAGEMGWISVDEIEEVYDPTTNVRAGPPPSAVLNHYCSPNPCNPATTIHFSLATASRVQVRLYDLRGRLIWDSPLQDQPVGRQSVDWRGRDRHGHVCPAGVYIYSIVVDGSSLGRGKISLVK